MAVYTEISKDDACKIIGKIGEIVSIEGIQEGVENTNYKIELKNNEKFIFTIFEKRTKSEDLPFFNNSMSEFYSKGIPCPTAKSIEGKEIFKIKGKDCCLYNFLNGRPTQDLNDQKLESLSNILSKLHKIGKTSKLYRKNDMLLPSWNYILDKFKGFDSYNYKNEFKYVSNMINNMKDNFPEDIKKSTIHADLFPDNIFFDDNKVSGVIDFFFTCSDTIIYDLATFINSWFFINGFNEKNCTKLLDLYSEKNQLTINEKNCFNFYLKVSAIRFFLTRLHDMYFNLNGQVNHKDPMEFYSIIQFHEKNNLQDLI